MPLEASTAADFDPESVATITQLLDELYTGRQDANEDPVRSQICISPSKLVLMRTFRVEGLNEEPVRLLGCNDGEIFYRNFMTLSTTCASASIRRVMMMGWMPLILH